MGGVLKRVVTAVTAVTVVTVVTAVFFFRNASHPVPPYDTYHITLSDFALRPPMSGYNGWESTHKHEHSSLYENKVDVLDLGLGLVLHTIGVASCNGGVMPGI